MLLTGLLVVGAVSILFALLFMYINKVAKDNDPAVKLLKPMEEEKGSAFMTMTALRNPVLLLSRRRRELTDNYLKGLTGANKSNNFPYPSESALDILNKRYANGEINEEEYLRMKRNIDS